MSRRWLAVGVLIVAGLWPGLVSAADRPAVFIHGFSGDGGDWAGTAGRLRERLSIDPRWPSLRWSSSFEDQARDLQRMADIGSLSASAVAIGHSNGGLVARQWSTLRPVNGIVTIGTPHGGAPLLQHLVDWAIFNDITRWALDGVMRAFSVPSDWWWVPGALKAYLKWTNGFSVLAVSEVVTMLGVQTAVPVTVEMLPGSSFLGTLNGSGNLTREATMPRVGVASIAHNYYWAGPARATRPDSADAIATALYAVAGGLLGYGNLIIASSNPADWASINQGLSLISVANQLLSVDPVWCQLVSHPVAGICIANDGVVPVDRQAYPGAPTLYIEGPAHTQERQQSDDVLFWALVNYLGVFPRGIAPPPDPGPDTGPADPPPGNEPPTGGDGGGGGGETGGSDGGAETHTPVTIDTGELLPHQELKPGDTLNSTSGRLHFCYQGDGNLVLYNDRWEPIWASDTAGYSAGFVAMQGDGNLVVYDADGVPRWASDTPEYPGARLAVQNDGNVVIYAGDTPVWSTNTFID